MLTMHLFVQKQGNQQMGYREQSKNLEIFAQLKFLSGCLITASRRGCCKSIILLKRPQNSILYARQKGKMIISALGKARLQARLKLFQLLRRVFVRIRPELLLLLVETSHCATPHLIL